MLGKQDLASAQQYQQSLFKTSHVTRRPSLKCLSSIQVQFLSLCMGKHQILQNGSLSLRLNFIFEITNEIGQLCHKCLVCSNSYKKRIFQARSVLSMPLRALTVSIATGTSNGSCSDTLTLPVNDWRFKQKCFIGFLPCTSCNFNDIRL